MSNRTYNILRVSSLFLERWRCEQELTEENRSEMQNACRTRPKPSMKSYPFAPMMISHPLCIKSNRYFCGLPLLSSLKIFRSRTSLCWQYYLFALQLYRRPFGRCYVVELRAGYLIFLYANHSSTLSNLTSTFTPARRTLDPNYVTISLEREGMFMRS